MFDDRTQLSRIDKAIAEFETRPVGQRIRYHALLAALHEQRELLMRRREQQSIPTTEAANGGTRFAPPR